MYDIEFRLASKNGFHTPAEALAYYKKYARNGITWHWWNSPDKARDSDHDNIVNYILGKASRGVGSVNYVLSNNKITLLVNPDNVAWASQSGNPTTISVELSPHLNTEGYKKAGWLFNELEGRYNKTLSHYKHSDWFGTQCPGTIDINRIKQEAAKWKSGAYTKPVSVPVVTPVPVSEPIVSFHLWKEGKTEYKFNKQPTHLYDVNVRTWGDIKNVGDPYNAGERIFIVGHVHNSILNRDYYITQYSYEKKRATGFSPKDLDIYVAPRPIPELPPAQQPIQEPKEEEVIEYPKDETKPVVPPSTEDVEVIPAERPYNVGAIAIRVFSTFYQAFIGAIAAGLAAGVPTEQTAVLALLGAAIAAGVSAVKNFVVKPQELK